VNSDLRALVIDVSYFIAAILFILGLKQLSSPATARAGNRLAAIAMTIAVAVTLLDRSLLSFWSIGIGMLIGAAIGVYFARTVKMTDMPQMVALFNGAGGATAALVALAEYFRSVGHGLEVHAGEAVSIVLGTLIGAISFSGSIVAFAKLQGLLPDKPLRYSGQMALNTVLLLACAASGVALAAGLAGTSALVAVFVIALALGVLAVLPIGGADMPVVISLLNSFTGVAAALTGFVVGNQILVVAGALVGASGMLLTLLMSKAMNRPLSNVLFGAFGGGGAAVAGGPGAVAGQLVRESGADDVAVALAYARTVVIVPGYGLAVAQAQHTIRELADELEKRGVSVKYAIHPVAGRMPGHMNVLLAEANVPYDQLVEMEQINGEFESTDVTLVVGANDVVNPAARHDPASPIFGMPILDVDRSRNVVVLKRSMSPGFAGIDNELFYRGNTRMLFGDARKSLAALVNAVKQVG
jgi:NAD(P) transhydrogenase subunit beta